MPKWQEDPELFLYIGHEKGNVLHVWRCKRMSSSMPLQRQDFTDEIPIPPGTKYLVSKGFSWPPASLKRLEEYIAPRHFLVNCQGLVYVELYKFGADEKVDNNQRIYLRLLDVINMDAFELKAAPKVPFRMVEYLEDGTPAEVCPSPNEMKLSAEVEDLQRELNHEKSAKHALEARVVDLESKVESLLEKSNKGLEYNKRVAELEDKINRMKERESNLITELADQTERVAGLQQKLEKEKRESKQALADEVSKTIAELNEKTKEIAIMKKQREDDKTKVAELTAKLVEEAKKIIELQRELEKEKLENKQALTNKVSESTAELNGKVKEIATLEEQLAKEKSFALEKRNGIKRYMLGARNLIITWGDTPTYWKWRAASGSRFAEVAELLNVCWLEINAQLNTRFLSPKTLYAAYFVFNFVGNAKGFPHTASAVHTVVNVVGGSSSGSSGDRSFYWASDGRQKRGDGWMEIEMGHFFNDGEHAGEVHMKLTDISSHWKAGLIVEGIELRPKVI